MTDCEHIQHSGGAPARVPSAKSADGAPETCWMGVLDACMELVYAMSSRRWMRFDGRLPETVCDRLRAGVTMRDTAASEPLDSCLAVFEAIARETVAQGGVDDNLEGARQRRAAFADSMARAGIVLVVDEIGRPVVPPAATAMQRGAALGRVLGLMRASRVGILADRMRLAEMVFNGEWHAGERGGETLGAFAGAVSVAAAAPVATLAFLGMIEDLAEMNWRQHTPASVAWLVHGFSLRMPHVRREYIEKSDGWRPDVIGKPWFAEGMAQAVLGFGAQDLDTFGMALAWRVRDAVQAFNTSDLPAGWRKPGLGGMGVQQMQMDLEAAARLNRTRRALEGDGVVRKTPRRRA